MDLQRRRLHLQGLVDQSAEAVQETPLQEDGEDRAVNVRQIIKLIASGDINGAQEAFRAAAAKTSVGEVAQALGQASPRPAGTIVVGSSMHVYGNPFRGDTYSWRCGDCPWTANNYKTERNARRSADEHAGEHPGIRVRWITRPTGT
jgi:hypothetical protein